MRARYYNPHLCRFINADPADFAGGLNFYAYADDNPVSMMDPFGLGAIGAGGFSWVNYTANDRIRDDYMAGYNQMQSQMASAWNMPAPVSGYQTISSLLNMTPAVGGLKMAGEAFFGNDFVTGQRIENPTSHAAWGVANLGTSVFGLAQAGAARSSGLMSATVASSGENILPASFVRRIQHGENIVDLEAELALRTYSSGGLEHAIISLQSGGRVVVSGGTGGIQFGSDLRRVLMHTHPSTTGPSAADFQMLQQTGQQHSYIYELFGGGRTRFNRR
jgi:hypothetical protein